MKGQGSVTPTFKCRLNVASQMIEKINFAPNKMIFHLGPSENTLNLLDNKAFFIIAQQPAHAEEVNIARVTNEQ